MNADMEEQEDELLALHSIFDSEEFVRDESKSAGELRVSVELPADFTVSLREGESLRQYNISFLPPLLLAFGLPEDYPSSSPPSFTLNCTWLTDTQSHKDGDCSRSMKMTSVCSHFPQLCALAAQLSDLYQATGGTVVLFSWVQFLKEDALTFLDIHNLLELPSDKQNTQHGSQDSLNVSLSGPPYNQPTVVSAPTESCNVLDPCRASEAEHLTGILTNGQVPSTSDQRNKDSLGAPTSIQTTSNSDQITQTSECELQSSEFKADDQNDVSKVAGKSKHLLSDQSDEEGFSKEGAVSASLILPQSSSDTLDLSEQGAASLPVHSRVSPQSEHQRFSSLSLTPSQTLLSQLLIYNATQKQKAFAATVFDCGVCFVGWLGSDCVQLPECGHVFCQTCLAQFCKVQITEGNVKGVTCPEADCSATPTPAQVKRLVGEELFNRYDRLLLQSTLDCMADVVYCPRVSCGTAVIAEKSSNAAMCPACDFAFCVTCRKTYHGKDNCRTKRNTKMQEAQQGNADLPDSHEGLKALWDDYTSGSRERKRLLESRYGRSRMRGTVGDALSDHWVLSNSKHCPHCFKSIEKDGGCNVMTCTQCGQRFCWLCLARLSSHMAAHFSGDACPLYATMEWM